MKKENSNSVAWRTIRQYWQASKEHKNDLVLSFLSPVSGLFNFVIVPFLAAQSLSHIIKNDNSATDFILFTALAAAIGITCNRIGFAALTRLNAKGQATLNKQAFEHVIQRGMRFHVNNVSGKLVADVLDYGNSYSTVLVSTFTNLASLISTTFIGLAIIFMQSWQLGIFMSCIVFIVGVWSYFSVRTRSNLRSIRHEANRDLTSHLSDTIVNSQTVKIFASEAREVKENKRLNTILEKLREKDWRIATIAGNNRMAFLLAGVVSLLSFIHFLSKRQSVDIGATLFALNYSNTLFLRLFDIDTLSRTLEESLLRAVPLTRLLDEELEVQNISNASKLQCKNGQIVFKNVSFRYVESASANLVFKKLNLKIQPGEKIGLVGPSGGGKSTLTKILLRFEDVEQGKILIDDQDISKVTQESLRSSIGYVPQEPLLFHRSIKENIAYGKQSASEDEILNATKKAYADDFILELPHQFDTIVGERGVKLSGGQRQRVAIARSILKNAPILVLDEATSALDSESEILVQKSMDELMKGKTTIVIAHRLSTIQKMDRIIVLDKGTIVEEGSHKDLLKKKNGHYARLWAHQSGGFLEE